MLTSLFSIEKHALITFIASFLVWFMIGGVLYFWLFRRKFRFGEVASIFMAVLSAWLISETLKKIFPIPRPFLANGQDPLTLTWPMDSSFPSAHASSAFALALSLRKSDKRLFFLYFIFAIVVAFGRVVSRVHYVVDVFAGALIGILTVFILERLGFERLFKRILA